MTVAVTGLRQIEAAMDDLTLASGRGVLRRTALKVLQPVAEAAKGLVAKRTENLKNSIGVGIKLTERQAGLHRRGFKANPKSSAEAFVGPSYDLGGGGRHGHLVEFGTVNHGPQPFMRPAWDSQKTDVFDDIKKELWAEISKAAKRAARKRARG